jgi:uncharacterized protein YkwD
MINLLIDDGSKSRSHRLNIFNEKFNYIGCATGTHQKYGTMTCIDYAAGFVPAGEKDPIEE